MATGDHLRFQVLSWYARDVGPSKNLGDFSDDEGDEFGGGDEIEGNARDIDYKHPDTCHVISAFGRTDQGESICVSFPFKPYFFVDLPKWHTGGFVSSTDELFLDIQRKVKRRYSGQGFAEHLVDNDNMATIVQRVPLMGFCNQRKKRFARLRFKTHAASRAWSRTIGEGNTSMACYESNIDPYLRIFHDGTNRKTTGWYTINDKACAHRFSIPPDTIASLVTTDADIDIWLDGGCKTMVPYETGTIESGIEAGASDTDGTTEAPAANKTAIASFIVASFDIEVHSPDGSFPDARTPGCVVFQVATSYMRADTCEIIRKHVVCLGETDAVGDGVVQVNVGCESDLIDTWAAEIRSQGVDVLVGYNIWGFDMGYLIARSKMLGTGRLFEDLNSVTGLRSGVSKRNLSSNAFGNNSFEFIETPGVLQLDLLVWFRREVKADSYKLDSVAERYLGERKLDVPPKEIFRLYEKGGPSGRAAVARYCVQDTILPLKLMKHFNVLTGIIEMASASCVPTDYILLRGQQIRIFSLLMRACKLRDLLSQP